MVLAEQATIPSQTLRGETGSEREQDRHMWLGQLGTEASPTATRIISGAGGGNLAVAGWRKWRVPGEGHHTPCQILLALSVS